MRRNKNEVGCHLWKLFTIYDNRQILVQRIFKRGRSVFDEERPGRPVDVVTEEIIEKVHDMILADRRKCMK